MNKRKRFVTVTALAAMCLCLPGCLLNSVASIPHPELARLHQGRAIVVVGVGLEAAWPFDGFELSLDEYSEKKRKITGNCFHYNRIVLRTPSAPAKLIYRAYDVPAGTYVYSGFNANARLRDSAFGNAFFAPSNRAVYLGDFVYVGDQLVEVRRNVEAARASIKLPKGTALEPAETRTVPPSPMFLCTP